jgi:hypothetical protein
VVPAFLLLVWGVSNVAASWTITTRNLADSWVSNGSRIAEQSLADLRSARPRLQAGTTLFFLKSNEKDLPWFFDTGGMFQVFYGDPSIHSLFADRGARLPPDYLQNERVLVLRFIRPHLYDMTEEYKSAAQETSIRLIPAFREANIWFDKREGCYPSYTVFDTPTSKPAFVTPIGRGSIGRDAIVLIAGTRLRLPLPPLKAGDRLAFSITIPFDRGDGAEGRVYFESEGQKEPLYARSLNPAGAPNDRRWVDEVVELGKYAGRKGSLVLECNSGPDLDVVGDWIAWSRLRVLPRLAAPDAPDGRSPSSLQVAPVYIREGDYVTLSIGNGSNMTIDCRYRIDGTEHVKRRWFTANSAGQFTLQPNETGKWEILEFKSSASEKWVPATAYFVVK